MSEVRLNAGGDCTIPGAFLFNSLSGIVAKAGGGQTNATQLTGQQAVVATVATAGDSVRLPQAIIGQNFDLQNSGAQPMQVFGFGADTINSVATATGVSHGAGVMATYMCTTQGNWTVQFAWPQQPALIAISTPTFTVPQHSPHSYVITYSSGNAAITLPAPTATVDDGVTINFNWSPAGARTPAIAATGLLVTGTASVNTATFSVNGGSLTVMAYQGKWIVQETSGITFS